MKQVPLTDAIRQKLKAAAGDDVDPSKLAIYEATALNSNPVRQRHPLYHKAVHTPQFLSQMADYVRNESLPLQVNHDREQMNVGRVFHAEQINNPEPQLRALFWVDKSAHQDLVDKIDNGTIDQVSVSILPKDAICNQCGFDFFCDDADFDNVWTGTCPQGHVMGKDGAYALSNNLDAWREMSLVARGGIPGARIAGARDRMLSDTKSDSFLTLTLSSADLEKPTMDLSKLVSDLTDEKAKGLTLTAQVAEKDKQIGEKDAKIVELTAQVADLPAKDAKIVELTGELKGADEAVRGVAKHLLALAGDATAQLPEKIADVIALITEKTKAMKLSFAPANAKGAEHLDKKDQPKVSSAFKAPR